MKQQREKEKKKMKKVIWRPEVEEEDEEDDDFLDDGEVSDTNDSDWAETPAKKKVKRSRVSKEKKEKKKEAEEDTTVVKEEIVQMLRDDGSDGEISQKKKRGVDKSNGEILGDDVIDGMKVSELKAELRKRGLLVGGKKDELITRLKNFFQEAGTAASESEEDGKSSFESISTGGSDARAGVDAPKAKVAEEASPKVGTPYAKKVKKATTSSSFDRRDYLKENQSNGKEEVGEKKKEAASNKPFGDVLNDKKSDSNASKLSARRDQPYWKTVSKEDTPPPPPSSSSVVKDERMKKLQEWKMQKSAATAVAGGAKRKMGEDATAVDGKRARTDVLAGVQNQMEALQKNMSDLSSKKFRLGTPSNSKKPKFTF